MALQRTTELGWYLERIKSGRLLTADEEKQLARRIREHSDVMARETMIQANLRLVVKIASDYTSSGMSLSDLVAEGNLGLMRAVEEFDPDAGTRFSTYAAWWIKQSIKRAMINASQPVHIPAYMSKLIAKWRRTATQLVAELGRPATTKEIAKELGISMKKAEMVYHGLHAVNAPSQVDSDETDAVSEMIADPGTAGPDQRLLDESNGPIAQSLLSKIGPRKRRILELRYGFDGHEGPQRTYKEIGQIIGLTRERTRQLEKEALKELRQLGDGVA